MKLPAPETLLPEIVRRLVEAARPKKVILFGSGARGNMSPDSDLDILVIEANVDSKYREAVRLRKALVGIPVPIDLLVVSQAEFDLRSIVPSTVYFWARSEGKVLYDAA